MIPIPSALVEFILLGPLDDRRQLQDSPILGDVWVEFGKSPADALDLLISPYKGQHAGYVASTIDDGLRKDEADSHDADIAYLQGLIVAKLTFEQMAEIVVPKTKWWLQRWSDYDETWGKKKPGRTKSKAKATHDIQRLKDNPALVTAFVAKVLAAANAWHFKTREKRLNELPAFERFIALAGLILWGGVNEPPEGLKERPTAADLITHILKTATPEAITSVLGRLPAQMLADRPDKPLVWQISMNRVAMPAILKSVPAVKADAAKTLFKVNCSEITWAVLDSGIDGSHPAFLSADGTSRVRRSFDFKHYRQIVNLSNLRDNVRKETLKELKKEGDWKNLIHPPDDPDAALKRLAEDARGAAPIHWDLVEKFVEIKTNTQPRSGHGTHVAGIIGASKETPVRQSRGVDNGDFADGMCPDISLYDFRVLGENIKNTEFAIVAALQFIRYLNSRNNFITIHGANLSLSIPHDVRNFACGRTPICDECERLIESGVVVVAAAGNHGYKSFETKDGSYDSYAAFSITDPGNADGVITVGATHRYWPHTYGVSFFSSRGPTGDGRLKPDLVAPGERIHAPLFGENNNVVGGEWGDLDGTSMAAPHVSGAAAMLMARYSELIGQPRRIKRILCENATDLGRERSFQGHGMLDVLRAFQAI
jgi:serine protease AprX